MRIGIDVGGTHTDAVVINGDEVIASTKRLTTADVVSGVIDALDTILSDAAITAKQVQTVMIGTTQFTNAIIERRELSRVAAIRIGLPSGKGITPMIGWPDDIVSAIDGRTYMLHGGFLYDGVPLAELQESEIKAVIKDLRANEITNIAISSAFSPMNAEHEETVAARIHAEIPAAMITLSHEFGRLGLMERENAAIMNTTLLPFAVRVVDSFLAALKDRSLHCPVYISQNDGTLMNAEFVRSYPALTFASGPTNSLRGAYKLTGIEDAIVIDIGGTTSDIGVLQGGFPRESNIAINIGGIRTNFRMPDILALGLGGGSIVSDNGLSIGPQSVGHRLVQDGLVFGGKTLTATDILVASGGAEIGNPDLVSELSKSTIANAQTAMAKMLNQGIEMMKPGGKAMPVILVGGGAALVSKDLPAASKIYCPENAGVANAIGAAIAQVGGETEQMVSYRVTPREEVILKLTQIANQRAIQAGADQATIKTVDIEETAIPYMDEGATRVKVKVIGELAMRSAV